MSEIIKLKVSAEPKAEFVSQGNFVAELAPGAVVETKSRAFADWLIEEYKLTEIAAEGSDEQSETTTEAFPLEAEYPADFPRRKVFINLGIPFETARNLERQQLIDINGIAEKTADEILAWQPEQENSTEGETE